MFVKIKVLTSFYEAELGKPFTEDTEDEMPPEKAKAFAEAGLVEIVGKMPVEKPVEVETAEMPEAGVEKAVKRSTTKRSK